jgi:SAM-dependent methyltransferase
MAKNAHQYLRYYLRRSQWGVGAVGMKEKYSFNNSMEIYRRFNRVIRFVKRQKFRKGIDFGTAHCALPLLAKYYKLTIVGLDKEENRYRAAQDRLSEIIPIVHIGEHEKDFEMFGTNRMDFIVAFNSITKSVNADLTLAQRIAGFARILRPKGVLIIEPPGQRLFVRRDFAAMQILKNKKIRLVGC